MKTIKIAKADPIGDQKVHPVTIVINDRLLREELPSFGPIKYNIESIYRDQANKLARALFNSLPQGTMDRLIIALMKRKTSFYRGLTKS